MQSDIANRTREYDFDLEARTFVVFYILIFFFFKKWLCFSYDFFENTYEMFASKITFPTVRSDVRPFICTARH